MAETSSSTSGLARQGTTPPPFYFRTNRISCDPCRRRKLKCDRVKPCSTCVKRNIQHQCYQEEGESQQQTVNTKRVKVEDAAPSASRLDSNSLSPREVLDKGKTVTSLAKCKEQMDAIVKIASQSSNALQGLFTELSNGEGTSSVVPVSLSSANLRTQRLVVWEDVCSHLPAVVDCEALLAFYFEELSSYFRISQRPLFEKQWRLLLDGTGIQNTEAAIIFTAFALADILIPSASSLRRHSRDDHHRWMTLLGNPTSSPFGEAVDNSFAKITLLCLTSIYHLYTGRTDHLWESVGMAMRKAIIFGLFDERTRSWFGLSSLEKEYRRRLAWYLLVLDRWQAFVRQLPFALNPTHVYLAEASFESDSRIQRSNVPAKILPNRPTLLPDGRLQNHISAKKPGIVKFVYVELLDWCQDYLSHFAVMSPLTRYNRASLLDDALERVLLDGLYQTGIKHQDLQFLSTSILDECIKERHVEITSYISSIFFLRCIITRRFLTDDNAPQNLRWASLTYAQGILSTIPSLTRLMNEGQVPVQTTWMSNFLLAAATTFTVVILGQDHYLEFQSNPLEADTPHQGYREGFPQQHLNWLAENIFIVVDCLETLIIRGNHSASIAKQLLERLCMAQGDLCELYRLRFNRIAQPETTQQQYNPHNRNDWDLSRTTECVPKPERANSCSSNLHLLSTNSSAPTTCATSYPADSSPIHSHAQAMSTNSLLDAVLKDPTEFDFLGQNNHMDLLTTLLKDSPPM